MNAVIVEDEATPRQILKTMVEWGRLGFDEVRTARNGLEALALLEAAPASVVLTDVRMPKMDGIALASEVRRRWPGTVLIFLSGYSDQEYLKSAIRVRAQDYLDKPIDLDQVHKALAEAARSVRDQQAAAELVPLRRQAVARALFGLVPGPPPADDRFFGGPVRVLAVEPGLTRPVGPDWVPSVVDRINGDDFLFPAFAAVAGGPRTVLVAADRLLTADPPSFDRALGGLLAQISALEPAAEPRVGVAPPASGPADLAAARQAAQAALADAFYRPDQRLHPVRPPEVRPPETAAEVLAGLRSPMAARDHAAVEKLLGQLEARCLVARDPDLARVRSLWRGVVGGLLEFLPAWGPAEKEVRLQRLDEEFLAAPDLAALADTAREAFRRLFVQPAGELHVDDRVKKAQAYMAARFADPDLTVDAVASQVGFSESYFCTVFKQSQGITVKDYVTRLRIDRAKAYLWEKNPPTLADLALKVGYRDPNYFSTVFKRLTGTSPGAYRKRALG